MRSDYDRRFRFLQYIRVFAHAVERVRIEQKRSIHTAYEAEYKLFCVFVYAETAAGKAGGAGRGFIYEFIRSGCRKSPVSGRFAGKHNLLGDTGCYRVICGVREGERNKPRSAPDSSGGRDFHGSRHIPASRDTQRISECALV